MFSWLFTRQTPLFTHDRYVLTYKELVICWFGGLRGAVGLVSDGDAESDGDGDDDGQRVRVSTWR